jgi:hypothetical protein
MRVRYADVLTALLFADLGCGAQPPAGVVANGSNVSSNGCTVDLRQICRSIFDQPEITVNGVKYDTRRLEQTGPRHLDMLMDYRYPNGEPLAAVNCQFDMSTHAVTRADLANGPPIDDKAVEYVRSQGLCINESNP